MGHHDINTIVLHVHVQYTCDMTTGTRMAGLYGKVTLVDYRFPGENIDDTSGL